MLSAHLAAHDFSNEIKNGRHKLTSFMSCSFYDESLINLSIVEVELIAEIINHHTKKTMN